MVAETYPGERTAKFCRKLYAKPLALEDGPLVSVPDAAQQLHLSPSQVRRWIKRGKLRGTKQGGHWWILMPTSPF